MTTIQTTSGSDKAEANKRANTHAALNASAELLFVILPFIAIAMSLLHRGELRTIFYLPEWSIVSAVIVGQAIVKLVSSVLGEPVYKEPVLLTLSVMLVCLLVPILILLTMVLTEDKVSNNQAIAQAVIFSFSAALYWIFAATDAYVNKKG
jgi:hypothetical protein